MIHRPKGAYSYGALLHAYETTRVDFDNVTSKQHSITQPSFQECARSPSFLVSQQSSHHYKRYNAFSHTRGYLNVTVLLLNVVYTLAFADPTTGEFSSRR